MLQQAYKENRETKKKGNTQWMNMRMRERKNDEE